MMHIGMYNVKYTSKDFMIHVNIMCMYNGLQPITKRAKIL